jgi:hypothetical protein
VNVAAGASDTVIAADIISAGQVSGGVSVAGATGTDIVNNDFEIQKYAGAGFAGISVTGGASATSIENNVFWGDSQGLPELSVDAQSAAGTSEGYNVLDLNGTSDVPYFWSGTDYSTLAAFQTASGQGTSDLVESNFAVASTGALLTSDDPAVGSANSAAPGAPGTDFHGDAWTGDDRGAVNLAEYSGATLVTAVDEQSVAAYVDVAGLLLGTEGSITLDWGDGSAANGVFSNSAADVFTDYTVSVGLHQYTSAGTYTITATIVDDSGTRTFTSQVTTTGSTYVPVYPTRVLDTRSGVGDSVAGAVSGGHSVAFSVVNGVSQAPTAGEITAVVLNVTVTQPQANGFASAYPDGTAVPKSSNLNYRTDETVPNLTTVMVGLDGKVDLYTSATTHLLADVEGYYVDSATDAGYHPISPDRLLDTRKGIGAPAQAVGPGQSIPLAVAGVGSIPSTGVVAAAMNVTVTGSSANGLITVFPAGGTGSTPSTSNVNCGTCETVANMAIVPLGSGDVVFTNTSSGTVQVIADVAGYYTSTGGDAFVPMAPWRALDTRNGTGQETSLNYPAEPDSEVVWFFGDEFEGTGYWDESEAAALVANVTVTQPTANGVLIAYPGDTDTVPTASNINFSAGETIPSMVMAACNAQIGGPVLYNESKGTTQVIADVFGYFS